MKKFIFGTFVYEYQLVTQERKTLSLTVTPDLHIILKCPESTDAERIEKFLRKKWFWLEKQLNFFKKYQRKSYPKEYISGESYFYLGGQYTLRVEESEQDGICFNKRNIVVFGIEKDPKYIQQLIKQFFVFRAEEIFELRYKEMLKKFQYKNAPTLKIRDMQKRWGSFLSKKIIYLNPKLIHTPKECIDYVIVHELCHMQYKNHSKKFWKLLDEKYPQWGKVKERLEMTQI